MTNYICINGKKAELTEEQMKALGIELPKKPSPFNRVHENESFYFIGSDGNVGVTRECYCGFDNSCYRYGNYCTDKSLMEQRALHETLNRLLWRYSMEHNGDKIDWHRVDQRKWWIFAEVDNGRFHTESSYTCYDYGRVYFYNCSTAQNAIEEVIKPFMKAHPDFKW